MTITSAKESKTAANHQIYLDSDLSLDFLRVVEHAFPDRVSEPGEGVNIDIRYVWFEQAMVVFAPRHIQQVDGVVQANVVLILLLGRQGEVRHEPGAVVR